MKTDLETLLMLINKNTDYVLGIIEDETDPPFFVVSMKYKNYTGDNHGFIHRITNLEAEYLAKNIFENIKELHGKEFILQGNYKLTYPDDEGSGRTRVNVRMQDHYSSPIMDLCKEIYLEIRFYEGKGYM